MAEGIKPFGQIRSIASAAIAALLLAHGQGVGGGVMMATEVVAVTCTRCGNPMRLPAHVADLPADERLCGACTRAMVAGGGGDE